jgi:anti-sigma B factor antagonist
MTVDTPFGYATDERAVVLRVFGEVDVATAPALRDPLLALARRQSSFGIVDMTEVSFIDSTGLSALVTARKRLQTEGCELRLVISRPNVRKVFDVTGLSDFFAIYSSVRDATAA